MDATQRAFCRNLKQLMAAYPTNELARAARKAAADHEWKQACENKRRETVRKGA